MQTSHWLSTKRTSIFTSVIILFLLTGCSKKDTLVKVDPEFSKYIESYTSGVISRKNAIRIQLTTDVKTTHVINETIKEELFDFSPSVEGKAYWVDERTIEFKPTKDLEPAKLYKVEFKLDKVRKTPDKFKLFVFNVQTIKPTFTVLQNGLKAPQGSKTNMILTGVVETADVEENAGIEKLLKVSMAGASPAVKWQHNEVNRTHNFTITNITRTKASTNLQLSWNGNDMKMDVKGNEDIAIPAIGDFKVLDIKPMQDAEDYVLVQFSDPVAYNQDLNGLITVSEQEDMSFTINGSEVKVYVANKLEGDYKVNVHPGINNEWGNKLEKGFTSNVFFENRLPSVKIHGRGTILPSSGGKLSIPFESINLKAVDISIIKIYENNIAQFLQTNDLNGENELRRVGKPLITATVKLDTDASLNLHKKNRFTLDIDKYLRTEPGAIYRINIGFRPEYSLYTCLGDAGKSGDEDEGYYDYGYSNSETTDEDDEFWNRYDNYYPYGYNWDQRDNPCSKSYYNKERFASRNILATNIGLTAKRGTNNQLMVAATDIISTDPMGGIELEVMDYQRQIISKGKTDNSGMATLELKSKPYLLIAKKGEEKSYLKLDDGSSLPLGRFDVNGAEIQNGIKGFIFGERGVWRPGDSLFLSCMIEDKENKLPEQHPLEMELYTPTGQLYKRMVQTNPEDGFNVFRTATDASAPTGNWNCKVKIGGAVFEKTLKIETVMPNRLKINLDFGGDNAVLGMNSDNTGTLSAKWLFGATAKSLKGRIDAQLYKAKTSFAGFEGYSFTNPTANFQPQSKTIFDGTLSEEGTATITPNFEAGKDAPGMLTANLLVKVFEPGGNFSIDNVSYPYNPYSSYMGIKVPEGAKPWGYLLADKTHTFNIANVDTKGKPVTGTKTADVEIYKIQWRWWWDNTGDNLSNFTQDEYNKLVSKKTISIVNGRANYNFKFNAGSYGRYLIIVRDKEGGHAAGETFYIDDPYWQTRNNNDDPSAAAMLSFTSDKEKYNVGDEVNLTIPSSKGGRALISIENGSRVLKSFYVETGQGETKYSFKTEKEMSPNVYVNVSLIQPHAQTINDLPIRMYGVIPIFVEDKNTVLKPVIKMPDAIKPEQENTITVSEANGKDMSYVIAIVDEGLLDLTRFKTPDPHKAFYAREALGVKSWDLFDFVIGAWGGELERILTIGGDSEGDGPGKKRANRFKPIVQFMGPFKSNGGSKSHTFTLPPYMGSVRAMVIARHEAAYGFAEKAVAVKKPLMLLATMPRVLGPGESLRIPVTVFATEKSIRNVTLSLQSNPLIEAVGSTSQNISFTGTGEQQVFYEAKVKPTTGIGKVTLVATSGKEKTVYEVELDIRNPNPPITSITEKTMSGGQNFSVAINAIGTGGSNKAVVEISSIPSINLQKRLDYLITYPHGCIEQTTSAVFPQLVLNQLLQLNETEKLQVDRNVKRGIEKIRNMQTNAGGFSYWPGYTASDDWGTNYAGHFLLEARDRGFNVPSVMLAQWRNYQRGRANAWLQTEPGYYGGDLTQAYRLYLLALAKSPELGAMNRLKEYKFITPEAKWRLAAAYQLIGQNNVALQLISGLPTNFSERPSPGYTFGSALRDQAMVLETLTLMGRKADAERMVSSVAAKLSREDWYSTQTTAYSLIAIAKFCGKNASGNKLMVSGNIGGENININSSQYLYQADVKFTNGKGNINITNKGGNVLYVRIINQGQPVSGEALPVVNHPDKLVTSVSFVTSNGSTIDPTTITQGTDFVAKVTVKNTGQRGTYNEVALSQIFPSGWEILNTRLYNSEGAFKSSASAYMDIRDDRVYHYFDIKQNETLTYYVQLNAAYPGRFYWPGVYCEAMYDNTISSGISGKWVEVKQ